MGTAGGKKNAQKFNFRQNSFHKRKIALECKFQSNFVYSLAAPEIPELFLGLCMILNILSAFYTTAGQSCNKKLLTTYKNNQNR